MGDTKYTTLFRLDGPYHLGDCPVLVEAGALLKNEKTKRIIIQLKMKNIGERQITACRVCFKIYDSFGSEIEIIPEHSYVDLSVKPGESFGSNIPVYVSKEEAKSYDLSVLEVIFADKGKWVGENEAWPMLAPSKKVEGYFDDPLIEEQYKLEIGESKPFIPEVRGSLFFCCCGDIHLASIDECSVCGCRESEVLSLVSDIEGLSRRASERIQREEEERKELERREEEKKQKRKESVSKLNKQLKVFIPAALAIALIVLIVVKAVLPAVEKSNSYKNAYNLLEQNQFDEAAEAFTSLGDYKDSSQMVSECVYRKAAFLAEQKEYEEAIGLYNSIIEYSDSKEKISEVEDLWKGDDYKAAETLFETGEKEKAINAFRRLGDYKDSEEKVKEITYSLATDKLADKDYEGAISFFKTIPDYKDSNDQIKKAKYSIAKETFENEDFAKANSLFSELGAYEDSENMAMESNYQLACKYFDEENYGAAIELFSDLGAYRDSADQLLEAKYLYCENNFKSSDSRTKEYLAELTEKQYKDAEEMNERLYEWRVEISAEVKDHVMQRESVGIDAKITSGPENAKTTIKFEFILPTGEVLNYCDEEEYSVGQTAEVYLTNDILTSGYDYLDTPFKVNVYNESGKLIGTFNDVASHWWDD